jgi:hemolysin activation/secretion protein
LKGQLAAFALNFQAPFTRTFSFNTVPSVTYKLYLPFSQHFFYSAGLSCLKNFGNSLPYYLLPALGYRLGVRGFEHFTMEGNSYLLLNTELKFKLLDKTYNIPFLRLKQFNKIPVEIYPKIFFDEAYVWKETMFTDNSMTNTLLNGKGVGLDIMTYYDKIIRLEYSFTNFGQKEFFLHFLEVF